MVRNSFLDATKFSWSDVMHRAYDSVILPWGAIEPHNYHMPYLTDCLLSHNIALDSANRAYETAGVSCAVLPPVYFGSQNPGQWNKSFCIHTNTDTQKAILADVVASLYVQRFRKLVILNGHGGNTFKPAIRDLAMSYPDFYIVAVNWYDFIPVEDFFEEQPDEHAGEQETSVMLYYEPELVHMEVAGDGELKPGQLRAVNMKTAWVPRNWDEVTSDTGIGNPQQSTAEKGSRYVQKVVERITDLLIELKNLDIEHT